MSTNFQFAPPPKVVTGSSPCRSTSRPSTPSSPSTPRPRRHRRRDDHLRGRADGRKPDLRPAADHHERLARRRAVSAVAQLAHHASAPAPHRPARDRSPCRPRARSTRCGSSTRSPCPTPSWAAATCRRSTGRPARALRFVFGLSDLNRARYAEAWLPANLIFDQFADRPRDPVLEHDGGPSVITNGTVTVLGANHWRSRSRPGSRASRRCWSCGPPTR